MKLALVTAIFVLTIYHSSLVAAAQNPTPIPWPARYSISFITNISWTDTTIPPNVIPGTVYYDIRRGMQRVNHAAGSRECRHFYHTEAACSLLFTNDGMYRFVYDNHTVPCCLDLPTIYATPQNFAENGTYVGTFIEPISQVLAHRWYWPDSEIINANGEQVTLRNEPTLDPITTKYHNYWQEVNSSAPLIFTFPSVGGIQDYHYLPNTFRFGDDADAFPPNVFFVPEECKKLGCWN